MLDIVLAFASATTTIEIAPPPETLLLVRMSPKSLANPPSSDRLFRFVERAIGGKDRVVLVSPEQAGVDEARFAECELERRLSCWVAEVRGVSDHLIVLSMLEAEEEQIEVAGFLIDLARASGFSENQIFESAKLVRRALRIEDDPEVAAFFAELLAPLLAPRPTGTIEIEAEREVSVSSDGVVIGVVSPGTTRIRGVTVGAHRIAWSDPRGPIDAASIDMADGAVVHLRVTAAPPAPSNLLRDATLWSGIGVAVAGAVVVSLALGIAPREERVEPCVGAGCESSTDHRFYAPGGVLLAPLGYSAMLAGGTASLGAALLPEDDLWIYLSVAAGVVLGGAAYGISAAAD